MQDKILVDLSKYRIETANESLEAALILMENNKYKDSISRSYYSIFASMRAVIALDNKDFKKHSGVISYFQMQYIKEGIFDKKYSDIIKNAFEVRNTSDYDDFYIALKFDAEEQYNNAKEFLEEVKKYIDKRIMEELDK